MSNYIYAVMKDGVDWSCRSDVYINAQSGKAYIIKEKYGRYCAEELKYAVVTLNILKGEKDA